MATNAQFSPYKASQIISERLGRTVRPQQVYGLIRANADMQRRNELGHLVVDEKFIDNYVEAAKAREDKKATKEEVEAA